ncbi:hypothetical protein D3C75_830000 [compost metagenome]
MVGDLVHLGRRHHLPDRRSAVHHALGQRLGDQRRRHRHRHHAERLEGARDGAVGRAQAQALQVGRAAQRAAGGVQVHAAVAVQGQHLVGRVLVGQVLLVEAPDHPPGGQTALWQDARQLQRLGLREAAGGISRRRPHHVGHALADLIGQLGRGAAQLHGGIDLADQASGRSLVQLVAPGLDDLLLGIGGGGQEMRDLEGDRCGQG